MDPVDESPEDAGEVAGSVAEIRKSLDACVQEIAHLEKALETRDIIGQAKGILMARQRIDADAAFDVLRRASQRTNSKLRDVANELVASVNESPPPPAPDTASGR